MNCADIIREVEANLSPIEAEMAALDGARMYLETVDGATEGECIGDQWLPMVTDAIAVLGIKETNLTILLQLLRGEVTGDEMLESVGLDPDDFRASSPWKLGTSGNRPVGAPLRVKEPVQPATAATEPVQRDPNAVAPEMPRTQRRAPKRPEEPFWASSEAERMGWRDRHGQTLTSDQVAAIRDSGSTGGELAARFECGALVIDQIRGTILTPDNVERTAIAEIDWSQVPKKAVTFTANDASDHIERVVERNRATKADKVKREPWRKHLRRGGERHLGKFPLTTEEMAAIRECDPATGKYMKSQGEWAAELCISRPTISAVQKRIRNYIEFTADDAAFIRRELQKPHTTIENLAQHYQCSQDKVQQALDSFPEVAA